MAVIQIENLIIEKKPIKEENAFNGKKYFNIIFFGYEEKPKYNSDVKDKKYYKLQLSCNSNNQELQKELLDLSDNDSIKIKGNIFGGSEMARGDKGFFVKNNFGIIEPVQIKVLQKSTAAIEDDFGNDSVPF